MRLHTVLFTVGAIIAVTVASAREPLPRRADVSAGDQGRAAPVRLPRRPVDLRPAIRRAIAPPPAGSAPSRISHLIPVGGDAQAGSVDGDGVRDYLAPAHHDDPIFTAMVCEWAAVADGPMQEFLGHMLKDEPAAPIAPVAVAQQVGASSVAVAEATTAPVAVLTPPDTTSELQSVLSDPVPAHGDRADDLESVLAGHVGPAVRVAGDSGMAPMAVSQVDDALSQVWAAVQPKRPWWRRAWDAFWSPTFEGDEV